VLLQAQQRVLGAVRTRRMVSTPRAARRGAEHAVLLDAKRGDMDNTMRPTRAPSRPWPWTPRRTHTSDRIQGEHQVRRPRCTPVPDVESRAMAPAPERGGRSTGRCARGAPERDSNVGLVVGATAPHIAEVRASPTCPPASRRRGTGRRCGGGGGRPGTATLPCPWRPAGACCLPPTRPVRQPRCALRSTPRLE
jgi:hypothetical protein